MYSLLYLVPKNWVSRCVGWIVGKHWPWRLHVHIRDRFIRHFKVEVSEAELPIDRYPTLGAFFIRRLRPGARPIGSADFVSPVDGMLTQRGFLPQNGEMSLLQVKGIHYSLSGLLGPNWDASAYAGGSFFTLYLAPWNYHRIHVPADGRVLRARRIPGSLWPVNTWSVRNIPDLFVRNERIIVDMDCSGNHVLLVLIGATNVGKIRLDFCPDLVGNVHHSTGIQDWTPPAEVLLSKGSGFGCFEMGSTVVLILDAAWTGRIRSDWWGSPAVPVRVGMDLSG